MVVSHFEIVEVFVVPVVKFLLLWEVVRVVNVLEDVLVVLLVLIVEARDSIVNTEEALVEASIVFEIVVEDFVVIVVMPVEIKVVKILLLIEMLSVVVLIVVVSIDIVIDVEAGFKIVEMLVVLAKFVKEVLIEGVEGLLIFVDILLVLVDETFEVGEAIYILVILVLAVEIMEVV